MQDITVYKETDDDWYPSFFLRDGLYRDCKLVKVSFMELMPGDDNKWRVSARGNDDMGLEREFAINEEAIAFNIFLQVIGKEKVNQQMLRDEFKFIPA